MWMNLVSNDSYRNALLAAAAMGVACAVLSVFVISRRWAFIGEGIGHAGFGGAGTVWLLGLLVPAIEHPAAIYAGVVFFCIGTALAIGWVSRRERVNSDAAIGIFLVASLAWGFVAREIYVHFRHVSPAGFDELLFGHFGDIGSAYALAAVMICAAVLAVVAMLNKEIVYYSFDPAMAEASGVRAGLVHYLLMALLAITIITGMRLFGSVLVPALLVLPGTTAMLLSKRLKTVIALSVAMGLLSAIGGTIVSAQWRFLPAGPMMVLVLFAMFLASFIFARLRNAQSSRAML